MRIVRLLFLTCFLAFAAGLAANGAYFPPITVAEPPAIPMQTALIRHDAGVQTLMVESHAEAAAGESFAWVLPLPAPPTAMEPAGASALPSLRALVGTRIVTRSPPLIAVTLFVLGMASAVLTLRPWVYRNSKRRVLSMGELIIIFGLIAVLAAIATPNFLDSRETMRSAEGVAVLSREAVGSYDVAVLQANGAEELDGWLAANGYAPLGPGRTTSAAAYVRDGWIFLAMKLRPAEGEPLEPHPLKVTFPSEKPVFPMRLTAAPGQKTNVAIFVAGQQPCTIPGFETIFRKRVQKDIMTVDHRTGAKSDVLRLPGVKGVLIGNPDVAAMVKNNEWLTRLEATLDEAQMSEDLVLEALPHDSREARRKLFARDLVVTFAWQTAFGMCFLFAPVVSWLAAERRLRRWHLGVMVAAVVGMTAWIWFGHPKTEGFRDFGERSIRSAALISGDIRGWLAEEKGPLPTDRTERRRMLREAIGAVGRERSALGGFAFVPGREPGQYYFATAGDGSDRLRAILPNGVVIEESVEDLFALPPPTARKP